LVQVNSGNGSSPGRSIEVSDQGLTEPGVRGQSPLYYIDRVPPSA